MPDQTITFLLTAKNLASKEFAKVKKDLAGVEGQSVSAKQKFGNLFSSIGHSTLAMVGLGVAVGVVGSQLDDMVKAALSDEESQKRLGASLRANLPAWDGSTAAIEANITAAQRLGFEDETLRDSLTVLVGATHDIAKAEEIMATAMDLARFKGIDLRTASEALIKVEGGHYRMLAQLGIKLGKNATTTEALAAVQAVAAGQAEAFADTTSGKLLVAQIKWGEVMEDLGRNIIPFLTDALTVLSGALDLLSGRMPEATSATDSFAVSLLKITSGWGPLVGGVSQFTLSLMGVKDPATEAAKAIASIGYESLHAQDDLESLRFGAISDALKSQVTPTNDAKDELVGIVGGIPKEMGDALLAGKTGWRQAWDDFMTESTDAVTAAGDLLEIEAKLQALEMSGAMSSADPYTRAAAVKAYNELIAQKLRIVNLSRQTGAAAAQAYVDGWNSNKPSPTGGGGRPLGMKALALGGKVEAGEYALVGEKGPEIARGLVGGGAELMPLGKKSGAPMPMTTWQPRRAAGNTIVINTLWPPTPEQVRQIAEVLDQEYGFTNANSPR